MNAKEQARASESKREQVRASESERCKGESKKSKSEEEEEQENYKNVAGALYGCMFVHDALRGRLREAFLN